MKVELFALPGCQRCAQAQAELRAVAMAAGAQWCEVDVLQSVDRAVELGVLSLPALAIDGRLVFASLPQPAQLRDALQRCGRA